MTTDVSSNAATQQTAKQLGWDLLRCICAFEICLVHVTLPAWFTMDTAWNAGSVSIALARAGTIGFLMLAGALLVPRSDEMLRRYVPYRLRAWLQNIVIAYAIYLVFGLLIHDGEPGSLTLFTLVNLHTGHFWFFWAIGIAYIAVIAMRWAVRRLRPLPERTQTALLLGSVAVFFAGLAVVTANGGTYGKLTPLLLLIYCGHVWTGYVLGRVFPRGSWFGLALIALGVAAAVLGTQAISTEAGHNVTYLNHRGTLFIGLVAFGQVLLILRIGRAISHARLKTAIANLSRYTIGIFIIHPMLLEISDWDEWWDATGLPITLLFPLAGAALMAASLVVVWTAQAGIAALFERATRLRATRLRAA